MISMLLKLLGDPNEKKIKKYYPTIDFINSLEEEMTKLSGKKISQSFLSQKLWNKTLRYYKLEMICQILGYEIKFEKISLSNWQIIKNIL